ncbi:MAG TPA: AAA family ATPase [Candidatus Omnitrophota bacterium]|nr:AAA family ATPase [Candidatus Omnitrophota bacterium]HRZ15635.1 AAA family ATPase [Candidatus Omnitrophota bacterium]
MYEKFYNFSEKPFNTTPDSKFFFPSPKHTEALNSLLYAINERKGFVVITGEIGAGKTTVIRTVLNNLSLNTKVAIITNTHLTNKELIAEVLEEFDVEHTGGTKQKLLSHLNKFLIQQLSADMNLVLIIDEAQNLSTKVMEEVRMLSNLETEKEKLIQIIMVGQPQLKAKLDNPKLEQFKQRISVFYHLAPLSRKETEEYIVHRLSKVSTNGYSEIFTSEAIKYVFAYSKGVPRLINLLCDSCLLSGYVYERKQITGDIVREVIKERDFNSIPAESSEEREGGAHKTYCCTACQQYNNCPLKWIRGTRNQEQLCCDSCQDYLHCMVNKPASKG